MSRLGHNPIMISGAPKSIPPMGVFHLTVKMNATVDPRLKTGIQTIKKILKNQATKLQKYKKHLKILKTQQKLKKFFKKKPSFY